MNRVFVRHPVGWAVTTALLCSYLLSAADDHLQRGQEERGRAERMGELKAQR